MLFSLKLIHFTKHPIKNELLLVINILSIISRNLITALTSRGNILPDHLLMLRSILFLFLIVAIWFYKQDHDDCVQSVLILLAVNLSFCPNMPLGHCTDHQLTRVNLLGYTPNKLMAIQVSKSSLVYWDSL